MTTRSLNEDPRLLVALAGLAWFFAPVAGKEYAWPVAAVVWVVSVGAAYRAWRLKNAE